jgi:hypothetical protein
MPMVASPNNILEVDLVEPIAAYFESLGYSIALEVPVYRNRADMVAYNDNELIAVELKLKNWKRALRQAAYYQLGADVTYIAMPFGEAFEVYKKRKMLNRERVGLLAVIMNNHEVRELIKPEPSVKKLDYIEKHIRKIISKKFEITDEFGFED